MNRLDFFVANVFVIAATYNTNGAIAPARNDEAVEAQWYESLNSNDVNVRTDAIRAVKQAVERNLSRFSDWEGANEFLPILREALTDRDAGVRLEAAESLRRLGTGPLAEKEVREFIAGLHDKDPKTRFMAAYQLIFLHPAANSAVAPLSMSLADTEKRVRERAALTLGALGPEGKAAVPILIELLRQPTRWFLDDARMDAAISLGRIGAKAGAAVPGLTTLLDDELPWVRPQAATALGRIGAKAKSAVPRLKSALRDRDLENRACSAIALWRITGATADALPVLLDILRQERDLDLDKIKGYNVKAIIDALGEMGSEAKRAIPILRSLNDEKRYGIGRAASRALKSIEG